MMNELLVFKTTSYLLTQIYPKLYGDHVSLSSQAGKTLEINKAHDRRFHKSLTANTENLY